MPKPLINQYFCAPKYGNGHKSCGKSYSLLPHTKRRYIVCFVFSVAYLHVYINQFWRKRKMKTNTKRFEKNMPHCHRCTSEAYQQAHTSRAYPGMLQLEHRWAWQRSDKILLLLPCFPFCVNRRARGRMPPQRACRWICAMLQILYGIIRWCGNFEASLFIYEQTCFHHFSAIFFRIITLYCEIYAFIV